MHAQVGHKRRTACDLLQSQTGCPHLCGPSALPGVRLCSHPGFHPAGQACPRLCALLVHLLSVVHRQGATSSPTDGPRPKKHTSVPGAAVFCLQSLVSLCGCGQEPQSVPRESRCHLELLPSRREVQKRRGRNWLNRENSCVHFCTKNFFGHSCI